MSIEKFLGLVTADLYKGTLPAWQARPLRALLSEGLARGASLPQIAYVLATAHHETARFVHMEEIASGEAYEGRADLGNTQPGDGVRFKGRGLVQITGRDNYRRMSEVVGVDLVADPDAAMQPDIACVIAWHGMTHGTFTGAKLSDYVGAGKCDFVAARRIVNGTDKAELIAEYARTFLADLQAAGVAATVVQPGRSSPAKSKTVQVSAGGIVTGAGGVIGGIAALDGAAQIALIGFGAVVFVGAAYLMRRRIREFAEGYT